MNEEIEEKVRKVFLEDLPRYKDSRINWKESIGIIVKGIYNSIEFEVEIIKMDEIDCDYIFIQYLDKPLFKIATTSFRKCMMGRLLGERTYEFKIKTGTIFKDDKRDITIIDREYRMNNSGKKQKCKWYKYTCNKCRNEDWIIEGQLIGRNGGCNACGNGLKKVVLGINTIWDTDRWMCDLGVSEKDAKSNTSQSSNKITVICPDCGIIKDKPMMISNIYKRHSIGCSCSDGKSYPEKYLISILNQLNINFIGEYSPKWCEFPFRKGVRKGRYDFYFLLNNKEYFIETDGDWHGTFNNYSKITAEESLYIDKMKDELAYKNNVSMIRIDCKKSISSYIKQNVILNIGSLFDLSQINWLECERFALGNLVKIACDYKKNNPSITALEISKIMKISRSSISKFLKVGTKLQWCNYTPKEDSKNYTLNAIKSTSKKVGIFKDDNSIGEFNSIEECARELTDKYSIKFTGGGISLALRENRRYKGYDIRYILTN